MTTALPVGWVLRASTVGFAVGCRVLQPSTPHFGDLVKVSLPDGMNIFGLIYDVQVRDDPAVRQLILAGELEPEAILDQRENRLVPIELSVLIVGYQREGQSLEQGLPPQPPISLDSLTLCDDADIRIFTGQLDYLRLVLNALQIPSDELLIANLRRAAAIRSPETRRQFLLEAGRELARLLSFDLVRLEGILRRIKP
ncbi:MAG: hypothetical protein BroJett011_53470 [Chloroflexota bacterium]|nr:MAG: hypothetical protein BroJett011_53470 [Chloroflexota bacterium]